MSTSPWSICRGFCCEIPKPNRKVGIFDTAFGTLAPSETAGATTWGLENRMWMHPNVNHLAPITVEMWKCWASLSDQEIAIPISNAVNNERPLKNRCKLTAAFPISAYDPKKCNITEGVHVRTRQDLPLGLHRDKKHRQSWWNVNRPFIRCGCPLNGPKEACTRKMIWFDHAVWCMIYNLDLFFPAKGHLCSKYAAMIGWLETAARDAVKASITFAHIRSMMIEGALEYATNPKNKLLSKYGDGAGIRLIERMIRPSYNTGIGLAHKRLCCTSSFCFLNRV